MNPFGGDFDLSSAWVYLVQWLIGTLGIYFFLTFLRRTRGNRLVRGLVATLLLGLGALWMVSDFFQLQELEYVVRGMASAAVVVLAIVFQPELRSAIGKLGTKKASSDRAGRVDSKTLSELAEAARSLARKRIGALVVIEGESALDPWTDRGVGTDASVDRLVIESIFCPAGALHDGAIVIRDDRLMASAVMLPLTGRTDLHSSTGTRHRAALGISEETDAVALIVSEETGQLAVASGGGLETDLAPAELEAHLRNALGAQQVSATEARGLGRDLTELWKRITGDFAVLGLSALIALGILVFVHEEISVDDELRLFPRAVPAGALVTPSARELLIQVPPNGRYLPPENIQEVAIRLRGTRAAVESFGRNAGASLQVTGELPVNLSPVPSEFDWTTNTFGVQLEWLDENNQPTFVIQAQVEQEHLLDLSSIAIHDDNLNPRYRWDPESLSFEPEAVTLKGSSEVLDSIAGHENPLLAPITLGDEPIGGAGRMRPLSPFWTDKGVTLVGPQEVRVQLDVEPILLRLDQVQLEIALICSDPARRAELEQWTLPAYQLNATFNIVGAGLLGRNDDQDSEAYNDAKQIVSTYVHETLLVFVDLAEIPLDGSSAALDLHWAELSEWETELLPRLGFSGDDDKSGVRLEFQLDSDPSVLLEPRNPRPENAGNNIEDASDEGTPP